MNVGWILGSAVVSFAIAAILGKWLVPFLQKLKYGQTILDIGPKWHKGKQGTPTMGGLMFVASTIVTSVAGVLLCSAFASGEDPVFTQVTLSFNKVFAGLAMAAAYLTGDSTITPYRVARYAAENGYYVPGQGTSWSLLSDGAGAFGISCYQLSLDQTQIDAALDAGQPVICSMLPGDFTTEGHFIVLTGRADNGEYEVHDPNSVERSKKTWSYDRLSGQIAALWACSRV